MFSNDPIYLFNKIIQTSKRKKEKEAIKHSQLTIQSRNWAGVIRGCCVDLGGRREWAEGGVRRGCSGSPGSRARRRCSIPQQEAEAHVQITAVFGLRAVTASSAGCLRVSITFVICVKGAMSMPAKIRMPFRIYGILKSQTLLTTALVSWNMCNRD